LLKIKKKANLYNVTLLDIKQVIFDKNNGFYERFWLYVDEFDHKKEDNTMSFIENRDKIIKFIDKKTIGGTTQVVFENDALNLLVGLTKSNLNLHSFYANSFREYAKKSSFDFAAFVHANKLLLRGNVLAKCQIKLVEISHLLSPKKNKDDASEDNQDENADTNDKKK